MDEKTLQRFWSKVNKDGPLPAHCPELGQCWVWLGKARGDGRGVMTVRGKADRRVTHVAWQIAKGSAPELYVLHACDNPACVRPEHLFLGTQLDNIRDMDRKGRRVNSPRYGAENGKATLTAEQVAELRALYERGAKQSDLVERYNVSQSTVSRLVLAQTWSGGTARIQRIRTYAESTGEANFNSKMTAEKVRELRAKFAAGTSYTKLAREFGIGATAARQIALRTTWRHVT